jgi:hypothetical protein
VLSLPVMVVVGALACWPIGEIYDANGWEFSNLGPIATAVWDFFFGSSSSRHYFLSRLLR